MKRFLLAAIAAVTVLTLLADDASAQLLRRRGNCNSCGVSAGCDLSGSQGCNISQRTQAASANDLFQLPAAPMPAAQPAAPAAGTDARVTKPKGRYSNETAMAFCAPVATKHERYLAPRPDRAVDYVAAASRR